MKKIIVIGCPGSGKTTFAQRLHDQTGIPLFYLDAIWHKADRTHISREDFDARLGEILLQDAWIIDGHYSRTLARRLAACDTVVLFDLPTEICLAGVAARLGTQRPDMPWVDTALDPYFKSEIEEFRQKNLPCIKAMLEDVRPPKNVLVFRSHTEADAFLARGEMPLSCLQYHAEGVDEGQKSN